MNGAVFVREGLGQLLTVEHPVDCSSDSPLCFRPLSPPLINQLYLVWKQYQVFTPIVDLRMAELRAPFASDFSENGAATV